MITSLLSGPILRRTTPNRVCLWLAASQRLHLQLQISKPGTDEPLGSSNKDDLFMHCKQLGEKLFVYLLQAPCASDDGYPLDTLLFYQVIETSETGKAKIWDLSALGYNGLPYPSFFIPKTMNNLLHGSCRKPHSGENCIDALSYGDDQIAENHLDLEKRPPLLLFTGDQIYADDVSIAVLAMLREKASELIGRDETLPATGTNPNTIPLHGRKKFLKQHKSGFTSSESQNHLLSFGEFAAMYIYVFGNAVDWQAETDWSKLKPQVCSNDNPNKEEKESLESAERAFDQQQGAITRFQGTLGKVRRLLANIPTYMIFDDHDVTDDWNITNDWYDEVRESPLGRRVVANALASYWAFQGWGNDVDNFDKDLQVAISQHLLGKTNAFEKAQCYDLYTWKHRGWSFSIPTNPPIIAIDSRTQRMPTQDSYLPVLLDRYARDWLKVEWAKLKANNRIFSTTTPVFIATTPVLGFSKLEDVQKLALWLAEFLESYKYIVYLETLIGMKGYLAKKVIEFVDIEAWTSNKSSFTTLMDCLGKDMKVEQCVFLSGDVHYAFSAIGKHSQGTYNLHCYQLTGSSLKNSPNPKQAKDIEKASRFGHGVTRHTNKLKELLPWLPLRTWETSVHLLSAQDGKTRVSAQCNLGLVEFKQHQAIKHTLLGSGQVIYDLPDTAALKAKLDMMPK